MPDWSADLRQRLQSLQLPPEREYAIVEELSQHLDDRLADLVRSGVPAGQARGMALDELSDEEIRRGGWSRLPLPEPRMPAAPAEARHAHVTLRLIGGLLQDWRYALRTLVRQPGYTLTATLTLALGLGGTTGIFAAVDAVLLRPMPFPDADRLVVPVSEHRARGIPRAAVTFADAEDWRREDGLFDAVAIWRAADGDLTGQGDPVRVRLAIVSAEYFDVMDVTPRLGRGLVPSDHDPGAPPVVVITQALWQERFGGDPGVIGRAVTLSGAPRAIVGVLPARQVWPESAAVFVPMEVSGLPPDVTERRDNMIFNALARVPEGVTQQQVLARLAAIATKLEQQHPEARAGWTNTIVPLREYLVSADTRLALTVLQGAVAAVLLIGCANVANLTLVRGSARARELAMRVALGASRRRLVQQLLTESLVLTGVGAAAGLGLAYAVIRGLVAMAPVGTPFLSGVGLDGRVLLAAAAASGAATLVSGLLPSLAISTLRVSHTVHGGSAGAGTSRRAARLRSLLIVAEIAATVVLVTGSALLMRSFDRLSGVDPGVSLERVMAGRIAIPASRYPAPERRRQFAQDLVRQLEAAPDIERAALSSFVPAGAGGFGLGRVFLAEGQPDPPAGVERQALWNVVTPHYFEAMGIAIVEGRPFQPRDRADTTPVMIVSRHFAEQMFPGQSSLGRRVRSTRDENVLREIVGVAEEVRYWGLSDRERAPLVYVPYTQDPQFGMLVVARSRGEAADRLGPSVRRALGAVDAELAIADLRTLEASAIRSISAERYSALLLSVLAVVALSLSALGIYGVTSFAFASRRRELGIRAALGASRASLYGLVFRQGFGLMTVGLAVGLAGAAGLTRWVEALLYETSPADPGAWSVMVGIIVLSTGVACLVPAQRAASVDPTLALRSE